MYSYPSTQLQLFRCVRTKKGGFTMNKKVFYLLIMVLSFGLAACGNSQSEENTENKDEEANNSSFEESPYQELPSTYEGLIMETNQQNISQSAEDFKVTITNNGNLTYIFDSYYTVERKEDNQWQIVPFKEGSLFQDDRPTLLPSQSKEYVIPVDYLEPNFTPGDYRLIKTFHVAETEKEFVLGVSFTVKK